MTDTHSAIEHLARITADAALEVLETVSPGAAQRGPTRVLEPGEPAASELEAPVVAAAVDYVDGITGGNTVLISLAGAHKLAAAMMGMDAPEDVTAELDEIQRSAVSETTNQIMAGAAAAVSADLGSELNISVPRSDVCVTDEALSAFVEREDVPHVVRTLIRIHGEPAWVVQHVPAALAIRVTAALEEADGAEDEPAVAVAAPREGEGPALADVQVDVWAELGRTRMPAGLAAALPGGTVVELDRRPGESIDLLVNGHTFARGELVVTDGTDWAFRITELCTAPSHLDPDPQAGT